MGKIKNLGPGIWVNLIIINGDSRFSKVLLCKKNKINKQSEDLLDFPNGELKTNETIEECCNKIALKKNGIKIENIEFFDFLKKVESIGNKVVLFFVASILNDLNEEKKIEWFSLEEINKNNYNISLMVEKILINKFNKINDFIAQCKVNYRIKKYFLKHNNN